MNQHQLCQPHIVLLTLERHQEGVWINHLVEALRRQDASVRTTILTLESVLNEESPTRARSSSRFGLPDSATILVNRVSDAANPILVKACIAFLHICSSSIHVVNGADAYSICSNKWCHHEIFAKAGLSTPRTTRFFQPTVGSIQAAMEAWEDPSVHQFLLKPNAGGFGEGIVAYYRGDTALNELPVYSDGILLLQEYHDSSSVYRIWFLDGRVLCGTVRNEITSFNGCAASAVETQEAYDVPAEVRIEIEDALLPLVPSALTGSVEFLYQDEERLYFDLNLLSTLPLDRPNAWDELASCILAKSRVPR